MDEGVRAPWPVNPDPEEAVLPLASVETGPGFCAGGCGARIVVGGCVTERDDLRRGGCARAEGVALREALWRRKQSED